MGRLGRLGRLGRSAWLGRGGRTGRGFKVESWLPIEAASASEMRGSKLTTSGSGYRGRGGRFRSLFLGGFASRLALRSPRRRKKNERPLAGILVGTHEICRGAHPPPVDQRARNAAMLVALYAREGTREVVLDVMACLAPASCEWLGGSSGRLRSNWYTHTCVGA